MKNRAMQLALAAAATMALSGVTLAQNVPEQFVVTGKAAEKIQDFTTINLATAERIADVCEKAAVGQGVQISIMVLDHSGNQVYMDRMDGQGYLNIITADMKARTALLLREPSKNRMNRVIEDPPLDLQQIQIGVFANSGGLPIVVNKQLIGAVGVGGSVPHPPVWSDEICAHKALTEVIGPSVAPLGPDLPPRENPNAAHAPVPRFVAATAPKPSLPAEFVVPGKAAGNVFDGNQISLATAKKIARVCRDWVTPQGVGMSFYVLDYAGEIVHMERTDDQIYANVRTALMKAQTALKARQPTSIIAAQLKNNPAGFPRYTEMFNFFTNAGGVPIVVDGQLIGAIGVGGAGPKEENCAIQGLKATFGDHATLPVYPAAAESH